MRGYIRSGSLGVFKRIDVMAKRSLGYETRKILLCAPWLQHYVFMSARSNCASKPMSRWGYLKTTTKKRSRVFITGPKISDLFKSVASEAYPDITPDELRRFSAHAIRVSAAVILQIAGKEKDFIQSRLRWARVKLIRCT